jgi:RNA polymerase sigma factor (TIGR02999 family)
MIHRVLVDHARARQARKRGGGTIRINLSDVDLSQRSKDVELLTVDRLLSELAALDAEQARVVELRFFGGLTFEEIAEALEMSPAAAKRTWSSARLWLRWHLDSEAPSLGGA